VQRDRSGPLRGHLVKERKHGKHMGNAGIGSRVESESSKDHKRVAKGVKVRARICPNRLAVRGL
jgi:hypothetical protein